MPHLYSRFSIVLLLLIVFCASFPTIAEQKMLSAVTPELLLEERGSAVHLRWSPTDADIPKLVAVRRVVPVVQAIQIKFLATAPVAELPKKLDSGNWASVPVLLLRDGRYRGETIEVYEIYPQLEQAGQHRRVQSIEAMLNGVALLDAEALATSAPIVPFGEAVPPSNPLAFGQSWQLTITTAGMQRVLGRSLAAAGLDLETLDPNHLHITIEGQELTIDVRGIGDGRLDPSDELRFWVPTVGDRWNTTTTAWLSLSTAPPQRMVARFALPSSAPLRSTGLITHTWFQPAFYDSRYAGLRGERWYAANLVTGPGLAPAWHTLTLTPSMPLAAGTMTATLYGVATTTDAHRLTLESLASAPQSLTWSGGGNWSKTASLPTGVQVTARVQPGQTADGLLLEGATFTMPVTLDIMNKTATFAGVPGRWRYQLQNVPSLRVLYDVSATEPQIVIIPSGDAPIFEDGPEVRSYVLAEPSSLPQPIVGASTPITIPTQGNAIIIAPRAFHAALTPLVYHRQTQGLSVVLVGVEDLYSAWSWGDIDPESIRSFLRNAAATWPTPPTSVLLVGDGSHDPKGYLNLNRSTLLPPYLADVDLWIHETACEACFAQLDGASPLDDPLPDMAVGRLPVKSDTELRAVVQKLIDYEGSGWGMWKNQAISIADNYLSAAGIPETAIDFPSLASASETHYPLGMIIQRLYYDPYLPTSHGIPWRESNAVQASARTRSLMSSGAVVAQFSGHSHYYQWATTVPSATPSYLLGLNDVRDLANGSRQPVVLEMTCLTSAFQQPTPRGTTIDEALVLREGGGAIATWGSSGLGVAHGHDQLHAGFVEQLAATPDTMPRLSELTTAGYLRLFTEGQCCQDALRTFLTLGDPLSLIQYQPSSRYLVYLPYIQR